MPIKLLELTKFFGIQMLISTRQNDSDPLFFSFQKSQTIFFWYLPSSVLPLWMHQIYSNISRSKSTQDYWKMPRSVLKSSSHWRKTKNNFSWISSILYKSISYTKNTKQSYLNFFFNIEFELRDYNSSLPLKFGPFLWFHRTHRGRQFFFRTTLSTNEQLLHKIAKVRWNFFVKLSMWRFYWFVSAAYTIWQWTCAINNICRSLCIICIIIA